MKNSTIDLIQQFHFDIVTGCQLKCVGCPTPLQDEKVHRIAVDEFSACLENVDVKQIKTFRLFNYGEPLLHDSLAAIGEVLVKVEHIKFDTIEISTNAQKCDWDDFAELLKLGVITNIAVSCDGDGTGPVYEKLRPPGKWEKLLNFFEKSSELVRKHSPETNLITRTIIDSQADIPRWEDVLKPYRYTPEFRGWKQLPEAANNTRRNSVYADGVCQFVENQKRLFVNAYGDVVPCCAHPKAGFFGNLLQSRFSEIVYGEARQKFVERLMIERSSMNICSICEFGSKDNSGMSAGNNMPGS